MAAHLGRTVNELLVTLDSDELTEWMAFDRIEPFGDPRADLRAGIIASTTANIHRSAGSKAYKPSDFMAHIPKPAKEKQLAEDLKAALSPYIKR